MIHLFRIENAKCRDKQKHTQKTKTYTPTQTESHTMTMIYNIASRQEQNDEKIKITTF